VLSASLAVTGIAMLGGIGVLPSVASGGDPVHQPASSTAHSAPAAPEQSASTDATTDATTDVSRDLSTEPTAEATVEPTAEPAPTEPALPVGSGEGKRIVFDQSDQRVWLVADDGTVQRTYLVSGSLYDNLDPGTYTVYSKSKHAYGIDDSGTMKWFVRFTQGTNGAAIGFHDIPVDGGAQVQTVAQLGTPQSHGCIRQERHDAIALWKFAPIGTQVVVTA
jgi:lipoprotein-anchoring transpeptidase ErfK/SrfK